jgi:two-component system sensor histidine kinase DegS
MQDHDIEMTKVKLEKTFNEIGEKLEQGRDDIFQIADVCQQTMQSIRSRLEEIVVRTAVVIQKVDAWEKKEKLARERLLVVSANFKQFTEADIKACYEAAQQCQLELLELRQEEHQLRIQRDDLLRQLRHTEVIAGKADNFLQSSSMALKVLQGNVSQFSGLAEIARQKEQIGVWLLESMELERRKIARELHDGPAQTLASILIRLDILGYLSREDMVKADEITRDIRQMGQECLNDVRRLMFDLKPNFLKKNDLIDTLAVYFEHYETRYDFHVDFSYQGQPQKLSLSLEVAAFRMIQEAVTNTRKHAGVRQAEVKLTFFAQCLVIAVMDRGKGFPVEAYERDKSESYGIIGMRERAELLGGDIKITSPAGRGTTVMIKVPL